MPWTLSEIHPLFVHFPIALFATGFFFDVIAQLFKKEELLACPDVDNIRKFPELLIVSKNLRNSESELLTFYL